MPPVLDSYADALYGMLEPVAYADESESYALALLVSAVGAMFQPVDELVGDTETSPGWSIVLDIDRSPGFALPWLGQFVGVTVNPALTVAQQRDQIRFAGGMRRGTPDSIRAAAAPFLTGAQTVIIRERFGGAYDLEVITFTDETPDPSLVQAAVLAEKPAGLILTYSTLSGQDFELVRERESDFAAVAHDYANFDLLRGFRPGAAQWPEVGTYPDVNTYPGP